MKRKNKVPLLLTLLLMIIFASGLFFSLNQREPEIEVRFSLQNNLLIGNEKGEVSLINAHNNIILDRVDLSNQDGSHLTSMDFDDFYIPDSTIEPEIPIDDSKPLVSQLPFKNQWRLTGERAYDYDVVEVVIEKGDCWVCIQRHFLPTINDWRLIAMGRSVNSEILHPIYPGNKRLFLAPEGFFDKEEPKKPEEDPEIPEDLSSNLNAFVNPDEFSNYIYHFGPDGNYAYSNLTHKLYQIEIIDNKISVVHWFTLPDIILDSFKMVNSMLSFTDTNHYHLYLFDGLKPVKVKMPGILETWNLSDDTLYYASLNAIYAHDLTSGETKTLYLGDQSTYIYIHDDYIYVANQFGSTISKSVIHKLTKDLTSLGWAEIRYASHTEIIHANEDGLLVRQNLHGQQDKIVIINNEMEMISEKLLDRRLDSLYPLGEDHYYGIVNGILYLYDKNGRTIDGINLQTNAISIQ